MKPIPEPVYPCKHCSEEYSWPSTDLNWSEIDEAWICDLCWGDIDVEQKEVCLADEIKKAEAKHDAEVIEKIKTKWMGIFEQENEVYTSFEIIDALDHEINQLRQKAQESE